MCSASCMEKNKDLCSPNLTFFSEAVSKSFSNFVLRVLSPYFLNLFFLHSNVALWFSSGMNCVVYKQVCFILPSLQNLSQMTMSFIHTWQGRGNSSAYDSRILRITSSKSSGGFEGFLGHRKTVSLGSWMFLGLYIQL